MIARIAFLAAFCLFGLAVTFQPVWISGFHQSAIDGADGLLNNYFLEHTFQLISNRSYHGTLWSPPFFYPAKNVLTYSDNLFGTAPIYWLFRVVSGPQTSFGLWMATMYSLNFTAFVFVLRRLRINFILSGVGGFLFAFGMARIMQSGHPQLLPQFSTPLAVACLFAFLRSPTTKRLNLLFAFTFWQLLSGIYLGWFLILGLSACILVTICLNPLRVRRIERGVRRHWLGILLSLLAWPLLFLAFLYPYINTSHDLGGGWDWSQVEQMLPRVESWLLPPPQNFWYPVLGEFPLHIPMRHEHHMFNGMFPLVAAILAIATVLIFRKRISASRRRLIAVCLLTFAVIFGVSLRFSTGQTPWWDVYTMFPGARSIRAVTRIWTIAYVFLLTGGLLGLDALLRAICTNPATRLLISLFLCFAAVSEQMTVVPVNDYYPNFVAAVNELTPLIRSSDAAYFVINDAHADDEFAGSPLWAHQCMAMMWAGIESNVPVVNGESAWWPSGFGVMNRAMSIPQLFAWLGNARYGTMCIVVEKSNRPALKAIEAEFPDAPKAESDHFVALTIPLHSP
jgi:hypothetical protein